ncbi:MAG: hypothetical protein COW13_04840 [Candidatus Omnitrophica bacterium CG12_big_fil_rev_8_21_14_0_65_50_5]|nr:MAG: hypothetical protein COW13_04840 [Candidatus Omnitrophica bacterium CG12_big_fil_rev_8_21_14_0_65_50_5]
MLAVENDKKRSVLEHAVSKNDWSVEELGLRIKEERGGTVETGLKPASTKIIIRSSKSDKYDRYLADVFIPQSEIPDPSTDIYSFL